MGANADLVRSGWEAFGRGDLDAAVATASDSAEIVVPESLPWGGTYTGPDGFKEMIGKFLSHFEEVDPAPQEFLEADGDHVVVTVKGVDEKQSGDYVINNKKRLDCFYGTDLRQLLDTLGVKNVVLMGINTNTCVLNTAFTAFNFDYRVVVLSDCVASMYGDDLHALGLQNVARCLGWVVTNEQLFEKIRASAPAGARQRPADALAK